MRPGLLILPFISLFVAALGTALKSTYPHLPWLGYAGWGTAAIIIALWVVLDLENFKALTKRKGAKYGASSSVTILIAMLVIIGLAVLSNRPRFNKSFDTTQSGINTLSDQSLKIINNLRDKNLQIETTVFFEGEQSKQQARDLLQLYEAQGANLKITYLNTRAEGLRAEEEKLTSLNTIIFRTGTRDARVTTFTEEKITNALIQTLKDTSRQIYFTTGHGESAIKSGEPDGLQWITQDLENNKYQATELSLLDSAKVPDDADLVVIAGPKYDFKEEEIRFIDDYISSGGPLLVMVDAAVNAINLNKLLEKYGLKFNSDLLILNPQDPRALFFGSQVAIVNNFDKLNAFTKDFGNQTVDMIMPMSRSVDILAENSKSMKVSAVGKTANSIIQVKGITTSNDLNIRSVPRDRIGVGEFNVIAVATGQAQAPATAEKSDANKNADSKSDVSATSSETPTKKELRIVAVGSGRFATNASVQRGTENRDLFVNMTNYLLQDEDFISIRPKDPTKSTLQLTSAESKLLLLSLAFIYPFVFLFGGIVHWIRRRRA